MPKCNITVTTATTKYKVTKAEVTRELSMPSQTWIRLRIKTAENTNNTSIPKLHCQQQNH